MTWHLGGSIAGLAALDSLNPATLVAITLILLSSRRRPLAEAVGCVIGAFATVFCSAMPCTWERRPLLPPSPVP